MEVESRPSSSHDAQTQSSPASDRRKSGRVSKKPELFSQSYNDTKSKRKRAEGEDDEEEDDNVSESESDDTADSEPDEEELREKKRAARKTSTRKQSSTKTGKSKSSVPRSSKKQKVGNGIRGQLALRPAANGKRTVSRPRKPKARPSLAAGETGLFGTCLFFLTGCAHRLTFFRRGFRQNS